MQSEPRSKNVVKFRRRRIINIPSVIFIIIVVYMIINIMLYFTKPKLAIYEVVEQSLAIDNTVTGVIIRDEKVYHTEKAGYVNYYAREGSRISKNTTVYSIDENKEIYQMLADSLTEIKFEDRDIAEVKAQILKFKRSFQNSNFDEVYDFKSQFSSAMLQLVDQSMFDGMQELIDTSGYQTTFNIQSSDTTGIITYQTDALDGLTLDAVSEETFQMENFEEYNLRKSEITEANASVYKLITSENWHMIAMIPADIYDKIKEWTSIKITILEDGLEINAPILVYQKGASYYIQIDLNQYMVRYVDHRFLELELQISSEKGLKIPKSSIAEKEFYMVPKEYFTYGGDSTEKGLAKISYDTTTGEEEYQFVATDIYYEDEKYAYVDMDLFNFGDFVYLAETNEKFQITMVGKLEGVFNVNKGYAVFRRIERLYENEAYIIVKIGTLSGISLYDHIALEASTAIEASVIY